MNLTLSKFIEKSFLVVLFLVLLLIALINSCEYFDGYEYLTSGMRLWGDLGVWNPKNVSYSLWMGLLYFPFWILKADPQLIYYHFFNFLVGVCYCGLFWCWIKKLNISHNIGVGVLFIVMNRIFIHYYSFSVPDIFCAMQIALWLLIDENFLVEQNFSKFLNSLALAGLALGRQYAVFIPLAVIAYKVIKQNKFKPYFQIIVLTGLIYSLVFSVFYALGYHTNLIDGLLKGFNYTWRYFNQAKAIEAQPFWIYFSYLYYGFPLTGWALLAFGFYKIIKQPSQFQKVIPMLGGSALCLLFLLTMGQKEARYLTPLLLSFSLLALIGWEGLLKKSRIFAGLSLGLLVLENSAEFYHFSDRVYRQDLAQTVSKQIAAWSQSNEAVFIKPMAPIYPSQHYFHYNDTAFYLYHYSVGAYLFHTRRPAYFTAAPPQFIQFQQYGYPVPDHFEQLGYEGLTMIVPAPATGTTTDVPEQMQPVYALRWWPLTMVKNTMQCWPTVKTHCVEVIAVALNKKIAER